MALINAKISFLCVDSLRIFLNNLRKYFYIFIVIKCENYYMCKLVKSILFCSGVEEPLNGLGFIGGCLIRQLGNTKNLMILGNTKMYRVIQYCGDCGLQRKQTSSCVGFDEFAACYVCTVCARLGVGGVSVSGVVIYFTVFPQYFVHVYIHRLLCKMLVSSVSQIHLNTASV